MLFVSQPYHKNKSSSSSSWLYVFHSLLPSTSRLLYFPMQFLSFFLSMWPNCLRHVCPMARELMTRISLMLNLFLISVESLQSDRLMLHIHLAIYVSVCWSWQISSLLTGLVSMPYNIALLIQASWIFPYRLCENNLNIRSGSNSLNSFHAILTWVVELASAGPLSLSMSPR